MEKDMENLEEYIKNHERAVYEKKVKDNTFWGSLGLKLESLKADIIGCACSVLIMIIGVMLALSNNADLGFSVYAAGCLFLLFTIGALNILLFKHNKIGKKGKIHTLETIKKLSRIEKYKDQALELFEIVDKPLPRKWWNEVVRLIDKVIEKDNIEKIKNVGGKKIPMDATKNNYHNEKMKTGESVALKKETVFVDRI